MATIALDIRFRMPSGASIAMQNLTRRLIQQKPADLRFVAVRYADQRLEPWLDELEAVIVPKMPAPVEIAWNELRLPGLLARAGVDLYHGIKQCAPYRLRCPSVHTVDAVKRGSDDELPLPLQARLYLARYACPVYQRSDHLLPVSEYVGEFLVKELSIDPDRVTVVHNGVDDVFFESGQDISGEPGQPLGIEAPLIICVGTVIPLKNQLAVVEALGRIADTVPHHLALLGKPDPAYQKQIQDTAERTGVTDRLHWIGFVDTEGLIRYLRASELMVHVSRTEGFCLATGEAMACGLPLVLSDRGALREQCGDAAAYIDDPDDHAGLAQVMLNVLGDSHLRQTMRQRGQQRARELSWSAAASKTLAVYRQLLAAGMTQPNRPRPSAA